MKSGLLIEGAMLKYLARSSSLPVPEVLYNDKQLLIMELVSGKSHFSQSAQVHAAELLAEMHDIPAPNYGFEYDTLIGGLHQPNTWSTSWLTFFREQRLLFMGKEALRHGRLSQSIFIRLEKLAARLDDYLEEPSAPSLLHGDAWTGNILSDGDRITAFLDPAIYYGHAEIELAFTTLFGTFSKSFFERYREIRPLVPGFMKERKDIYNLYPLLVHVRLFGGGYQDQVDQILRRIGI
jgi:fructosamine-3-kinase